MGDGWAVTVGVGLVGALVLVVVVLDPVGSVVVLEPVVLVDPLVVVVGAGVTQGSMVVGGES